MRYLFALLLFFRALPADEHFVVLPEEKVHQGDYFAGGGSVEISGRVTGDVYAFGSQITVDGAVDGDVIAAGGTIDIAGTVGGSARLVGGQVEINGTIKRNATIMGGNLQLNAQARIGGNAVFTGGLIDLSGDIGGNLTATSSSLRLSGDVQGNVIAHVGSMRLNSRANISGNLEYSSNQEAQIEPGAEVGGKVIYHTSVIGEVLDGKWKKKFIIGSKFTGALMNFLFTFVLGWIFIKFFQKRLKSTQEVLDKKKWRAFWIGVLIALLLPISCLILFITILGFPFGLALLAISVFGFYSAKIFPIIWASNKTLHKLSLKKELCLDLFRWTYCLFSPHKDSILWRLALPYIHFLRLRCNYLKSNSEEKVVNTLLLSACVERKMNTVKFFRYLLQSLEGVYKVLSLIGLEILL